MIISLLLLLLLLQKVITAVPQWLKITQKCLILTYFVLRKIGQNRENRENVA